MKNFWQKLEKPILCLAPMAGITDSAFCQLCKSFGADVVYTEMISADGLFYDSKKTLAMLKFSKSEKPVVLQLFGKRPETFVKAAKAVEQAGFDGIDINFGCPARKVVAHGGGVTLMRDLPRCREIVAAVISGTRLPVSVKIRTEIGLVGEIGRIGPIGPIGRPGMDSGSIRNKKVTALDFIKSVKNLPVAAIMVHGRSYEQGFAGPVDYEMIKKVKERFSGAVIANGGLMTPEDIKLMLEKTGADGVGLARGVLGRPWLFEQGRQFLATEKYQQWDWPSIKKAAIKHAGLAHCAKGERGIIELRKHLVWYVKGMPGARGLRTKLVLVKNLADVKAVLGEK